MQLTTYEEFIIRTKANLEFIEGSKNGLSDKKCFEVTQLINSLLGILVVLNEENNSKECKYKNHNLAELTEDGWTLPVQNENYKENATDLNTLIKKMRHAIAHRNIMFSNDKGEISGIQFKNFKQGKPKIPENQTWEATMSIDCLRDFTNRLLELISPDV